MNNQRRGQKIDHDRSFATNTTERTSQALNSVRRAIWEKAVSLRLATVAAALCLMVSVSADADTFLRGVTVSCYRWGPGEWDTPAMEHTLDELGTLGVDAVAIHPYARIRANGAVSYRPGPVTPATLKPLEWAHGRGMTTLLKPHLAHWGSGFGWRGEITFKTTADWERFFAGYRHFIIEQARLAEQSGAAWFAVGTELAGTLEHEAWWRGLIAEVRAIYGGKLTYAANWDETVKVPFWDALDAVGVQAYYPVADELVPSEAVLRAGWARRLNDIDRLAKRFGKPVLLTELGYAVSEAAALRPWEDAVVGDAQRGAELKLRATRVALEAVTDRQSIAGVFLWKWFPGTREHGDEFVLQYPAMKQVIREAWLTK